MDQEIKNSELFLKNLPVSGGFEVPSGYFERLEEQLELDQTEIIETNNPFQIPEAYFEGLNQKILARVEDSKAKQISLFKQPKLYWLSGIAAATLLVSLLFLYRNSFQKGVDWNENISEEEIAEQLNTGDLNEEFLCDAGWCVELEKLGNRPGDVEEDFLLNSEEGLIIEEL